MDILDFALGFLIGRWTASPTSPRSPRRLRNFAAAAILVVAVFLLVGAFFERSWLWAGAAATLLMVEAGMVLEAWSMSDRYLDPAKARRRST